jgi:hypothetical protein
LRSEVQVEDRFPDVQPGARQIAASRGEGMLISDQKSFIFVHIYKTGGSSLTRLLGPYVEESYRNPVTRTEGDGWQGTWHYRGRQHDMLSALRTDPAWRENPDLSRFRICTVVRNPYSWALSVWNDFYRRAEDAPDWFNFLFPKRTFHDFCRAMKAASLGLNPAVWGSYPQLNFIADAQLRPAFVARFERLGADVRRLLDLLDIPFSEMPHEIPNCPDERIEPMSFYDDESLAIVNALFVDDFREFGYPMVMC